MFSDHLFNEDAESAIVDEAFFEAYTRSSFSLEQWQVLCNELKTEIVDAHTSGVELRRKLGIFFQIFLTDVSSDAGFEEGIVRRLSCMFTSIPNMTEDAKSLKTSFGALWDQYQSRKLLTPVDEVTAIKLGDTIEVLQRVEYAIIMSCNMFTALRLIQNGSNRAISKEVQAKNRSTLTQISPIFSYDANSDQEQQKLLQYYFEIAHQQGLRKFENALYKPKMNEAGQYLYCFEYNCDISDFIWTSIGTAEENPHFYNLLTRRGVSTKFLENAILNTQTRYLPFLRRNPNVHAFQNGLYHMEHDKFYYFDPPSQSKYGVGGLHASKDIVALKYHDQLFDEEGMSHDMQASGLDPAYAFMAIKIPPIHQIFNTQGFNPAEKQIILGLLGRMLYPIGSMDNWAVFPYFLGLAGTGKSTLLRLLQLLFEKKDVGIMSNTSQRTFALDGFVDKKLFLGLDIDEHFTLDQATFQSMVCGEEVSIIRKNKIPLIVEWTIPGGFAGNKLPSWTDNGGSLSRRLVIIEYLTKPQRVDPNLKDRCEQQLDRFLKLINCSYRFLVAHYANRSLDSILPKKFLEAKQRALTELNSLQSFIQTSCVLNNVHDVEPYHISLTEFRSAYRKYCRENHVKSDTFSNVILQGTLPKFGIRKVVPTAEIEDVHGYSVPYFLGVKLVD